MGLWTGLKAIFSTPKVVDAGLSLAKRGADAIDMCFYTDEEKAQARQSWWKDVFLPLEKVLAPQGAIRSVTRRIIANDFCKVYLFLFLADLVVYPFNAEWSKHILELIKILTYPVSGIILFYFGSYGVGTYLMKKKENG